MIASRRRAFVFPQKHDSEEDLDWWSKYYASNGDLAKSGNYLEKGYDKIKVRTVFVSSVGLLSSFSCSALIWRGRSV